MPTYTYLPANIGSPTIHKMRFMLADVGQMRDPSGNAMWLISDEELTSLLDSDPSSNFNEGLATACDNLASKFAHEPDLYEDETQAKVEWKSRFARWESLAKRLRRTPSVAGGIEGGTPAPTAVGGVVGGPDGLELLGL